MKKSLTKTTAFVMAAMLAGTACMPMNVYAAKNAAAAVAVSAAKKDETEMKDALTKVKSRITVPKELTEFSYETGLDYGKKTFLFTWRTPDGLDEQNTLFANITGNVITQYYDESAYTRSYEPCFSKLTPKEMLDKAKAYMKQLNPDIYSKLKFDDPNIYITGDTVDIGFDRYENGVEVYGNSGRIRINKSTGKLIELDMGWWEDAVFADAKNALSETEKQQAYMKLCDTEPVYRVSSETNEETGKTKDVVRIVYDFNVDDMDAFTGKESTMLDDMRKAGGRRFFYGGMGVTEDAAAGAESADFDEGGVEFSEAELKKIQQDNSLITPEKAFDILKNDTYAGVSDSYIMKSYDIYSTKDKNGKEKFTMSLYLNFDKTKAQSADKYYSTVRASLNAETGEIISLRKGGYNSEAPMQKPDISKLHTIAKNTAKSYAKDIYAEYKPSKDNTEPVSVWTNSDGKQFYETERSFTFNRYANGIRVDGDYIRVGVDANGIVTEYYTNRIEGVTFPKADILSKEEAFKKLFEQTDFEMQYDGWVTDEGEIHSYLIFNLSYSHINAKTGKLCAYNGGKLREYTSASDVKYTDIKGIPQENAIRTLQMYNVVLTKEKKFEPNAVISEQDFANLLAEALGGYTYADEEVFSEAVTPEEKAAQEAAKKDKAETTREEAAVMFTQIYDTEGISKLTGIFKTPYSDVKSNSENIGSIAIAYAKGFFQKTADGKFNGSHKVTRAEAMQLVYDYLVKISQNK